MQIFSELTNQRVVHLLKQGAIGVIPTDTIYGIVASAAHEKAVERLYKIRGRDLQKACIVLVGKLSQISDQAAWTETDIAVARQYWPGPVSIILPITSKTPQYLHRGQQTLAYRMPDFPALQTLLQQAGSLVAPSANLQGQPPATTLTEAQAYFGDLVDFYVDGGKLGNVPSRLIKVEEGRVINLRS